MLECTKRYVLTRLTNCTSVNLLVRVITVITLSLNYLLLETVRTKTKTLIGALISAHRAFARNTFNPGHFTILHVKSRSSNSSPTPKYCLTVVFDEYK